MRRMDLCRVVLLVTVAGLIIARFVAESTPPERVKPTGPMPDFDYRSGEWLEGFCAMLRFQQWEMGSDWMEWAHDPRVLHYYDLSIDYPDREVKINCELKTIDIDSKAGK